MSQNKSKKVFCIGLNKTGTTSIGKFFELNGLEVARQREGEILLEYYLRRDFNEIIKFCQNSSAKFFQDVPFSCPFTFQHLDNAFPNSKFILTIRNSSKVWYKSILKFHSQFYNQGERPTYESLKNSNYVYKGWSWDLMNDVYFHGNIKSLYDQSQMEKIYQNHLKEVLNYFRNKPNKLIVINLSKKEDCNRLYKFLGLEKGDITFPYITSNNILKKNIGCSFID